MAQAITTDAGLLTIYKRWYTDEKLENLLWRNSPGLRAIKKKMIGGRTYNFNMLHRRGGGASADFTVAITGAATGAGNAEMEVPPGNLFSVFNITLKEKMGSAKGAKAAYIDAAADKMFAATESLRKQAAAALYASGYGEFGRVPAGGLAPGVTTATLPWDAIAKVDVGDRFEVTNGNMPADALHAGGPHTITAIDGQVITFAPAVPAGAGWAADDWFCFVGGRDAGNNPNYPTGLAGWLPAFDDRAGADWLAYIGTAFYGTTRSINTDKLAGNFVLQGGAATMSETLIEGIATARRAGSKADIILLNDVNWLEIQNEVGAFVNLQQIVNESPAKTSDNAVMQGFSELGFMFSTSGVKRVFDDPYCPYNVGYILDSSCVEYVGLTNPKALDDGVAENQPGVQYPDDLSMPSDDDYKFVIDDMLTVEPGAASADGPAKRVTLTLYGNFCVRAPGKCCVVHFI